MGGVNYAYNSVVDWGHRNHRLRCAFVWGLTMVWLAIAVLFVLVVVLYLVVGWLVCRLFKMMYMQLMQARMLDLKEDKDHIKKGFTEDERLVLEGDEGVDWLKYRTKS